MERGEKTKQIILDEAIAIASKVGLESLTIGKLAVAVGMSKSGLFAHFSSKENLQVAVLKAAAEKFVYMVITPSLQIPRGEPRIRTIFENWIRWENAEFLPGGCIFLPSIMEFDDQPGPARNFLVSNQKDWLNFITGAAQIAIEEGHFREALDIEQFTYEFHSIYLAYHFAHRFMRDENAKQRAMRMLKELLDRSRK